MSSPLPPIVPSVPVALQRCPLATKSVWFPESGPVRCVLDDNHGGLCKLIDGHELVAVALSPADRYLVMGLPVPERLRPPAPPWYARLAFWRRSRRSEIVVLRKPGP
jgi:hypothetical protein